MPRSALSFVGLAALLTLAAAQDIRVETKAINIEIPVRVFKGTAFVDNLTIADFEVTDNGRPQRLEAVYLVKKTNIERREENRKFAPRTARHFFLFFELGEFDPKLSEALEYFVSSVLIPEDELTLVTPMKTYRVKSRVFERMSRKKIFAEIVGLVRRDILIGYSESRGILEEMKSLAQVMASLVSSRMSATISGSLPTDPLVTAPPTPVPILAEATFSASSFEEELQNYVMLLDKLQSLRVVEQKKFVEFAQYLKMLNGQKDAFVFYEREFIPKIDPRVLSIYMGMFNDRPEITHTLTSLFEFYRREVPLDVDGLKQAYSDSSTTVHFMFISRPRATQEGIVLEEQSEDVFAPFMELARATGGFAGSSANLVAMMKSAVEASENYYLLYFRPLDYVADGKFHDLSVKVKTGSYRVTHRAGYIAD
ncbi:MAG: hypothetical protein ABSG19_15095 [Candidatus Aminicenantales bacterium]